MLFACNLLWVSFKFHFPVFGSFCHLGQDSISIPIFHMPCSLQTLLSNMWFLASIFHFFVVGIILSVPTFEFSLFSFHFASGDFIIWFLCLSGHLLYLSLMHFLPPQSNHFDLDFTDIQTLTHFGIPNGFPPTSRMLMLSIFLWKLKLDFLVQNWYNLQPRNFKFGSKELLQNSKCNEVFLLFQR